MVLRELIDPPPTLACEDTVALLRALDVPSVLHFTGRDTRRQRVIVTLLHGNEPSGCHALRQWIKAGLTPATNLAVIVAAVPTALTEPVFSHRMLPGRRDLNRCFHTPSGDAEGRLAAAILNEIDRLSPEAVIDMHNTSGSGPAFGVCPHWDAQHEALISLFAPRLVISSLRLGALMEFTDQRRPTVTIEVGGRQDAAAHALAWEGWQRFALQERILSAGGEPTGNREVYEGSIRLELRPGMSLAYAPALLADYSLTLRSDIERFNFGKVEAGTILGWSEDWPHQLFSAVDSDGHDVLDRLVRRDGNSLVTAAPLRLFMVTTHPDIARQDCLFYAVPAVDDRRSQSA